MVSFYMINFYLGQDCLFSIKIFCRHFNITVKSLFAKNKPDFKSEAYFLNDFNLFSNTNFIELIFCT